MKKIKCLLVTLLAIFLVGCSTDPIYYSEEYVKQYVKNMYGKDCDYIDMRTEKDEEGNDIYIYNFIDEEGVLFSVRTFSTHIGIDASASIFYQKAISNNYIQKVYEANREELTELLKDYSFESEFWESEVIQVCLNSYTQLDEVAEFVVEADKMLDLEYNDDGYDGHKVYGGISVEVYLKPDNVEMGEEWKEVDDNHVCGIAMSSDSKKRWTTEEAFTIMEMMFVNGIKMGEFEQYQLPDSILYKYPAPWISLTAINGNSSLDESYAFKYDVESNRYWISDLDLCQDFDEFPYNYMERGTFASLVEALGGTYSCDDWTAVWEIGKNKWKAELETDPKDSYRYNDMTIKQNGKKLKLSNPGDKNNGTTSGRSFTVEDLEAMLGVVIEIDQISMTATMTSQNANENTPIKR